MSISATNFRTRCAISNVRIERNPETMSELYDALSQRRNMRNAHLTEEEQEQFTYEYLSENAPDLLPYRLRDEGRNDDGTGESYGERNR